ncbi:MAG: hypothetical protein PPP58_08690 [Natronomonas sp.]
MQHSTIADDIEGPSGEYSDVVQRAGGSVVADEVIVECGPVLREEDTEITVAGYRIGDEGVGVELSTQVDSVWVNAGLTPEAARTLADRLRSAAAAAEGAADGEDPDRTSID